MTTSAKQQAELAKIRSQELMDTNNSAASSKSDQLLSILEAGKGSSISRDLLDQHLQNYLESIVATPTNLNYNRTNLRKCLSIKEKIAYITGLVYADEGVGLGVSINETIDVDDTRLRDKLEHIITHIEEHLINNRDFTESRILRNAAVNRFECKLTTAETNKLNAFANKVKEECKKNGLETLEESTHFTHESDAQKILKLSDVLIQMSAMGVNLNEKLLKEFETFNEKIQPLKNLDKHYNHVTKTLNMLHRIAQKGYHSMTRPKQQKSIQTILQKLNMEKMVEEELIKFNNIENFDKNDEHLFLDDLLEKIKTHPEFKTTIYSMSITQAQFTERCMTSWAYTLMQEAKIGLQRQKGITFGSRLKDFETDTQSRRGLIRRRIFDIADRMGAGADFVSETDFNTANSYFNKFKDLFFAKEEDNYLHGPNRNAELHYHKMEKVVSALVRRRVPALAGSSRIRRGSAGRIAYKFIENALKQKDRGLFQRIRRIWHSADDATVVAMVIMTQNEATNQVFYQDQDKSKKADSRRGKLRGKISFAENGRKAIRDRIAPTAKKALTFTEEAVKKGLMLSKGVTKVGNKVVAKTGRAVTRSIGGLTGKFNTMIEKGYKRRKTPLYLPYILTAGIEPLMKLGYKGSTYLDRKGGGHLDEIGNTVKKGYDEAKDLVSKATGQETNYLFQGLTYATEQTTSLLGKTVAAGGQWMYNNYTTGQQRSILGAFYAAAKEQKGLEDLMQSSELGEMLNLKVRGPYLFDEDGRVTTTEKIETKDENEPEEAGKLMAKDMEKNLDILLKQANEEIIKLAKEEEKIENELVTEENTGKTKKLERIKTEIGIKNEEKTTIKDIHDQIANMTPVIKKPIDATGKRKEGNIRIAIKNITDKLDDGGGNGYIPDIKNEIKNGTGDGLEKDIEDAKKEIKKTQSEIKKQEGIKKTKENLIKNTKDNKDKKDASEDIIAAEEEIAKQTEKLQEAETKLETASTTLKHKRKLLARLTKINNTFINLDTLNTEIGADEPTKEEIEKLNKIRKNLDILLYPEKTEDKEKEKISLKDLTEEQKKKIEEILNAAA